ncbi:hypothetical protein AB0J38_41110 [Streptomyces sp. NPDC050095]|uniref:hypothetical protein n=1 Tax=unclassified Streptomyces TaxID=2593676 RepID=UPI003440258C
MPDDIVSRLSSYLSDHFTEIQEESPELLPGLDVENVWHRLTRVTVFARDRETGLRSVCHLDIRVVEDAES